MSRPDARRGTFTAGVVFLALAVAGLGVTQNRALERRRHFPPGEDILYLPRPSVLRFASLGHTELFADLIFLRATIYFGGQISQKGSFVWLENYLSTITALDPYWKTPYRWAGVATMYNGKKITNDMVKLSSRFLELGVDKFPNDWELPFMLGCNYLFELHSDDPAERDAWQQKGAEWVRRAAIVGGAPPWVPLLAATIMKKEGEEEAAMRHLEEVYVSTQDEKTRAEVKAKLIEMHSRLDLQTEERERSQFEASWKRTLPYVPADFFVAVGPPPPARLSLRPAPAGADL